MQVSLLGRDMKSDADKDVKGGENLSLDG
jgi:hypothetical protein